MLVILFLSFFFANSFGQLIVYEKPQFNQISNFNQKAYSGLWYEISKISNAFEYDQKCSTINFELNEESKKFSLFLNGISAETEDVNKYYVEALLKENDSSEFIIRNPDNELDDLGTMTVLDTDYENYSVRAGLIPYHNIWLVFGWIDSRKPTLSSEHFDHAVSVLSSYNIPTNEFINVNQTCTSVDNSHILYSQKK
ncbi:hypothetical protein HCN44_010660 [Aphidius gifuensis]|uniref:Lipocalin/cytosolic fatty-acid binding domain-containing protein n=1 Tax=Aphidius gifuensis TaxID=684658 RepID=A0A835CPG7_APHGI|nr:crustacyanin-A2 subunit-like [Aphidius gifuensis]KAF7991859.1 hypothetical protein HCN44_010660 [Aphidius gifuensis]